MDTVPITLLGPQHAHPSVRRVLAERGVTGPVAVITAGWQEREAEDGVVPDLGVQAVNLTLHARADDVFRRDKELADAIKARQLRLKHMQDFYRVRLDRADEAARSISVRHVDPVLLADERRVSLDVVRRLDQDHVDRCKAVRDEHERRIPARERPAVIAHRRELEQLVAPTAAIVIAGGHVAVLLNRMRLFDVAALFGNRPIIAWSAGAMVLSDRIVLFHDDPPHGKGIAELLEAGLGLAPGIVVLPDPRRRLRLDDTARVAQLAQRFAPAPCVAMDHGARVTLEGGAVTGASGVQRLGEDGAIARSWP